ncbi:MAG: hypothetical protein D6729_11870, partial [Deltaproteobacteria bacterium]
VVATGEGGLRLLRVQPEGRRPMDAGAFLAGHPLPVGARLGLPAAESEAGDGTAGAQLDGRTAEQGASEGASEAGPRASSTPSPGEKP